MGRVYRATDTSSTARSRSRFCPRPSQQIPNVSRASGAKLRFSHPQSSEHRGDSWARGGGRIVALVLELVEGPTLAAPHCAGREPARRSASDREADRRRAAGGARTGHHPPRSQAGQHQTAARRHGQGARLRAGEGALAESDARATISSQSPTITSPAAMTGAGMLLGTAAYMSPEQAKGRAADKRSDVWALGCVLFEMLTGQPRFEGDDVSDTLANVLKSQPDWSALPPMSLLRSGRSSSGVWRRTGRGAWPMPQRSPSSSRRPHR